jgi:hypothetical protein
MASSIDNKNALSARAHIEAAKAASGRKDLELQQAENFARLIQDDSLRDKIMIEIRQAR